jgi:4-amino-4-deoxy-L-arabinose transferase-like glycosyltransferase
LIGIYRGIAGLFRKTVRINPKSEWITLSGVVLTMVVFSFSRYVLPHYIFVFYPLAAILTAKTLAEILENPSRLTVGVFWIQFANVAVIWITGFLILVYVFPTRSIYIWLIFILAVILSLLFITQRNATEVRVIVPSVIAIVGINFILNSHFYPELLKFQSDIQAAAIINKSNAPRERVYTFNFYRYSLEFKTGKFNAEVRDSSVLRTLIRQKNLWVFTDQAGFGFVRSIDSLPKKVYVLNDYPVTLLTGKFLNAKTREKVLKKTYLMNY